MTIKSHQIFTLNSDESKLEKLLSFDFDLRFHYRFEYVGAMNMKYNFVEYIIITQCAID